MKKRIFVFLLILINFFSFSQNVQFDKKKFGESVLENGLELFTLEDFSDASVKVQFVVRAGISFQNQENTGFFTLYTQILEELFKNSFILKDLKARMEDKEGHVPEQIVGSGGAAPRDVYESMAEMKADISNPQYHKDEAFRNKVLMKIQASKAAGTIRL